MGLTDIPICGESVPELATLDQRMQDFMRDRDIGAGVLGVMQDGDVHMVHGLGWMDEDRTIPTQSDAMFRLASVTKPLTAATIRSLIDQGALALDDRVFDLGQPGGGILALEPFGGLGDARLRDVTVEHLLHHRGGWDSSVTTDYTYQEVEIAAAMGVPSPAGRENIARYVLGQPLQHDPGEQGVYANLGYMLLGMIAEEVSGEPLLSLVQERTFASIGVPSAQVQPGRTFAEDKHPLEPWYDHRGQRSTNVFDPDGFSVPHTYGGWDMEARIGQGGIIADGAAILAFLEHYTVAGPDIGLPRDADATSGWTHYGSFVGTVTIATQQGGGLALVAMLNRRHQGEEADYAPELRALLLDEIEALEDGSASP